MIIFPGLRTRRIAVTLREITLGEAKAVCRLPADRDEATTTEFLRRVADKAAAPAPGYVTDPRFWTIEERARVVCHYLSQVSDVADFGVGEEGKLSDYIRFEADLTVSEVALGKVAGKERVLRPLLGVHAELLENLCSDRSEWLSGVLACQVQDAGAPEPDYSQFTDIQLLEWGMAGIAAIDDLPESEFEELYFAWEKGRQALAHFFTVSVNEHGIVFMPHGDREGGPQYPARFRALPCISKSTRSLFARPDQSGR